MKCIEEEIPFEVPEGWEWCRLHLLTSKEIKRGKSPKYANLSNTLVFAQKCNLKTGEINLELAQHLDDTILQKYPSEEFMRHGDIVINSTGKGTLGRVGIFRDTDNALGLQVVPDSHITIIRTHSKISCDYLYFILKSLQPLLENSGEGSTNQKELKPVKLQSLIIPIPPRNEQNRIITQIELSETNITLIDKNKSELIEGIKCIKAKMLDLAIRGKLISQNSNNEPASILLERIRAEKEELIKQGKIKRDKRESIIFKGDDNSYYEKFSDGTEICIDEEIPFGAPNSWEFTRLSTIVVKEIKRGKCPKYVDKSNVKVFAQKCNLKTGGINLELAQFLDEDALRKYSEEEFMVLGDIVINSTGTGTLGRVGYYNEADNTIVPDSHITIVRSSSELESQYVFIFLKSLQSILEKSGEGSTNQKELKPDTIKQLIIPVPPIKEQKKIVKKVEKILYCLSKIEASLN